jgi:hypothetical protein
VSVRGLDENKKGFLGPHLRPITYTEIVVMRSIQPHDAGVALCYSP